jgi:hypothetical protein
MILTDQQVIENTHFEIDESERLIAYTNLPDGDRYAQAVSSKEAVQKNMIGWCNTVREHVSLKAQQEDQERVAKKQQRRRDPTTSGPPTTAAPTPEQGAAVDSRQLVIDHFLHLQQSIDSLGEDIAQLKEQRNAMRDERDQLAPVMTAWGVTE